jgi:hypothetical protein
MSQLIIMNKENAEVGLGIRVQFFDKVGTADSAIEYKGYSVVYRDNSQFDGWIIFSGDKNKDGPWMFMSGPVMDRLEILGEL